jgi:hypothetical protein
MFNCWGEISHNLFVQLLRWNLSAGILLSSMCCSIVREP